MQKSFYLLKTLIRNILSEEAIGLHGAGMTEKELMSRLGYGGIQLNPSGKVTDEEADAIAKKISKDKPERIYAYSRGAAALSKAVLDDDMSQLPPVTYVAPAALRGWTDAPVPAVPGGSLTIIGDKDEAVPVKQACNIAKQAGTPLFVYPGKSHVSILYTKGEVGGDAFEIDVNACVNNDELPDWGGGSAKGSKEDVAKQQQVLSNMRKSLKKEGKETMKIKLGVLRTIIREVIEETVAMQYEKKDDANESEFTYAIAKAAKKGDKSVDIDGEKFPVKMSKKQAKKIVDELDETEKLDQ